MTATRDVLWLSLPDERPGREVTWLASAANTRVTAVAAAHPSGDLDWLRGTYRRPVHRFVEAGALAWLTRLADLRIEVDWVGSLELCSLVTGQATRWAERNGVRQLVFTWENLVHQPLYHLPPYRGAFRGALRRADLFVCQMQAARQHLREHGVDDDRIVVIPPPVDAQRFAPADTMSPSPVAVFVSPLARNKGIDTVLQAWTLVRRRVDGARLDVVGSGPLEGRVRQEAAVPGSGIRYLGRGGPEHVASALRGGRVFVTAPRATWKWNEQFGLAYLEAMASGLPIVTTVCGTNDEAVRAPNLLVSNNPMALADGLASMLADPVACREIGAVNRKVAVSVHDPRRHAIRLDRAMRRVEER